SIAGRYGGFGQADYCLASDMLCKLIGTYRGQRPWIRATGFHWHAWDDVGMAAKPETKKVLNATSNMQLMPAAEGIRHLLRELAAGLPQSEVVITEQRYQHGFLEGSNRLVSPRENNTSGQDTVSPPLTSALPSSNGFHKTVPRTSVPLKTYRCEMRTIDAPISVSGQLSFDTPVWILGDNTSATALAQRLRQNGVVVYELSANDELDQTLANMASLWESQPAKYLFLMTGRDEVDSTALMNEAEIARRRHEGIIVPFFVAQQWYKLMLQQPELGTGSLVAAVSLGGDFGFGGQARLPDGGGIGGVLKSVYIEDSRCEQPRLRVKVIDAPASESCQTYVDAMLCELAAAEPEVEVCWSAGTRRVVRPIPAPLPEISFDKVPRGGTWVVTGGARGITAISAHQLAARYGWKLHLLGKSPAPQSDALWKNYSEEELRQLKKSLTREAVAAGQSPGQAWDRVLKDVEIRKNLELFAQSGVSATYHSCDVTDRDAVAKTLTEIRSADGPITGIMHGAGLIEPGRFEHKRRPFVETVQKTKFDGLLHLLSLTQNDPLTHCIGFGSISGRFGGNGLSDYAAGNESMVKVLDWFRSIRPDCVSFSIHWESWEGAGIATLPRFAWGPKSVMNMKYMMPEEGVRRLEEELAAGAPQAEVLYTFGGFHPMFYPHEQRALGEFDPASFPNTDEILSDQGTPLLTSIRKTETGCVGDMPLHPVDDTFLALHRLRNKPLLPVVVSLEAIRECAAIASGKEVIGFENVDLLDGLIFHSDTPVVAQVEAKWSQGDTVECNLTCDFRNRSGGLIHKDRPYLKGNALLAELGDSQQVIRNILPADIQNLPTQWQAVVYPEDGDMYHGLPFRCLQAIHCDKNGGWGKIFVQPLSNLTNEKRAVGWGVSSAVLDSVLVACGCHVWLHQNQAVSLPRAIQSLSLGRLPRDGETCFVRFQVREMKRDSATYDFTLLGADGAMLLAATGYRKVILARKEAT
ncbi:MAG: NAD(P)-dependent dehydrogenase (short-subunit alcohol dehydrogenase family), partial [Pirellulaceae bacterium]